MFAAVALFAAVAVVMALAGCGPDPAGAAPGGGLLGASSRTDAPELHGDLVGGGTFDLADHAGTVVVVNFWGSWCRPCWAEADDLEKVYQATRSKGAVFIGVDTRDARDEAAAFLREHAVTYPSIFDPPGKAALGFDVPPTAVPSTILIDRQGRVAMVIPGAVLSDTLEPLVDQLTAEPTGGG